MPTGLEHVIVVVLLSARHAGIVGGSGAADTLLVNNTATIVTTNTTASRAEYANLFENMVSSWTVRNSADSIVTQAQQDISKTCVLLTHCRTQA
jgi:hypothetical protein